MPGFLEQYTGAADGIRQRDALARETHESLFPLLLFRAGVTRQQFEGTIGDVKLIPVPAIIEPNTEPRKVGVTPPPREQDYEFFAVRPRPFGDSMSVNLPRNYATAVGEYWVKHKSIVMLAAQTMNRVLRNELFSTYCGGHSFVDVVAGGGVTITVNSLNGFREATATETGYPVPVSTAAPKQFKRNGVVVDGIAIINAVPTDAAVPLGPGVLTLSADAGFVAGDRIDAVDAPVIIRPGYGASVDSITAGNVFTPELVQRAVAQLRTYGVGPHSDGRYHLHFPPVADVSAFAANTIQRQMETQGLDYEPFLKFAVGDALGCYWFANQEAPVIGTVTSSKTVAGRSITASAARVSGDIGAELINKNGVQIMRAIVTGADAISEQYVDESAYMTENGYLGRVEARVTENRGVEVRADGIRFVDQAPTDLFGENILMGWSWTGHHVCPSNAKSGGHPARFKRAAVIECAMITEPG